jgi:formate hydrogenlyase subunit 3/multisubunit Na+/H+ antiporter MnhD subunit
VVLMMVAHGLSVALLFLLATSIHHRTHTFDLNEMGGLAQKTPVLAAFFVAATLASIGLPGFANFWGELTIFVAAWKFSPVLTACAVAGVIISAIYGLRAAARVFFGPATARAQPRRRRAPAGRPALERENPRAHPAGRAALHRLLAEIPLHAAQCARIPPGPRPRCAAAADELRQVSPDRHDISNFSKLAAADQSSGGRSSPS